MFKIAVYDVLPIEVPYFKKLDVENFDLKLFKEPLNAKNIATSQGSNGVLVNGLCSCDKEVVNSLGEMGIKYLFTRSAGFNNIDLQACKNKGIMVANVPNYSPASIAELSLSLGLSLHRKVSDAVNNTENGNFKLLEEYFVNEINSSTIGIIGVGHIGSVEAKMYEGLGAKVLGYNRHPKHNEIVQFVSLNELLEKSDIISLHVPYVPGENNNMISTEQISKMKDNAILINTSRAQIVDIKAVTEALEDKKLGGYGTDVVTDLSGHDLSGHDFGSLNKVPNENLIKLMQHFPNVLVTPHMGFFTVQAVKELISISFRNFKEVLKTGHTINEV